LREGARARQVLRTDQNPVARPVPNISPVAPDSVTSAPACSRCGERMKLRVAKADANVGKSFWGCMKFPDCRGTREAAGG
jgi:restriction system protein